MNYLIFGDLHITQASAKECIMILEEIGMLANKHNVETLINLGDTFDTTKPSSLELDIFSTFINRFNKKIIIISANSHESTTQEESILNHFGLLNPLVSVVKEYKNGKHMYCGHFILKESSKNFGTTISKKAFKDYLYVFLGHQHSFELLKPNCVQLGSCRYINFDESKDKAKIVALITSYGEKNEQVHFLKLKSPIPMIQLELSSNKVIDTTVETLESTNLPNNRDMGIASVNLASKQEASTNPSNPGTFWAASDLVAFLDKTDPNTKIKVKIMDFESFKEFLPFESKYKVKFTKFVRENNFELISDKRVNGAKSQMDLKESFNEFTKEKQIDNKIKEIINREIKC